MAVSTAAVGGMSFLFLVIAGPSRSRSSRRSGSWRSWSRRRRARRGISPTGVSSGSSRFLFLIPAHDEAGAIGITVRSCRSVAYDPERFQICVIADNCTDGTAAEAAAAGAVVVTRRDPARRSKGFALDDFFRGEIADPEVRPCDAFVLVDADTSVAPDLLAAFDRALGRGDDFTQGYYTVRNAEASWRTRLMTYAFGLANGVWPLGMDRLGLSVGLKGNGMCFRSSALRRFPWRAHGLVEDMEFAWQLRLAGERVRFEPSARVYGEMVSRGGPGPPRSGDAGKAAGERCGRRSAATSGGADPWAGRRSWHTRSTSTFPRSAGWRSAWGWRRSRRGRSPSATRLGRSAG